MKNTQVDLENGIVHIAHSKTANGIGHVPMTLEARSAFQRQLEETREANTCFRVQNRTRADPAFHIM